MERFIKGYFYNPSQGNLSIDQVIEELTKYISEKNEKFYEVIVGCDSSSGKEPSFPVAIVILRKGEGGRFFLKKISYQNRKFYNWKERILEEVLLSCQFALFLKENLEKEMNLIKIIVKISLRLVLIKKLSGGFAPTITPLCILLNL